MKYIYTRKFHSNAYFITLILMTISLPLSKYTMSVFQFLLVALWLWSGLSFKITSNLYKNNSFVKASKKLFLYFFTLPIKNFIAKFQVFFQNKAAMILVSLFILHLVGLIYTTDFTYAFKDLRTKLPLLVFPIILSTMKPINKKQFNILIFFYIGAVLIGSIISTYVLLQHEFTDIRKISIFISPIRFSLNICIAIFSLVWFTYKKGNFNIFFKLLFVVAIVWLVSFLFIIESGIGILIVIVISICLILFLIFSIKNKIIKFTLAIVLFIIPFLLFVFIKNTINDYYDVKPVNFSELDKTTALGNHYVHDTINYGIEEGKYVGLYLSRIELGKSWNKRSNFDYNGKDENGQNIKHTIIRYLSSKGYRKDAEALNKLCDKEIKAIEQGIANVNYLYNPSLKTRISKIIIGYNNFKYENNPNGNSILQRIEYFKTSIQLIRDNFWIGVGTGDLPMAFQKQYQKMDSPLEDHLRWRSHNQFLSIFIGFGVIGFILFLFTLISPPIITGKFKDYFYVIFFITMILSMLTEDTIESQAGVTLFAFLTSLLIFSKKD